MTNLIVATHKFANAPKNDKILRLKKYISFNKSMINYWSNNSLRFSYRLMLRHFMFYKKRNVVFHSHTPENGTNYRCMKRSQVHFLIWIHTNKFLLWRKSTWDWFIQIVTAWDTNIQFEWSHPAVLSEYLLYYNMFPSTQLTFKYNTNAICFDLSQSSSGWSKNRLTFHRFYFVHFGSHMPYTV